ncbi:MAG: hypothetical protein ACHQ6V_03960 [Myxococcota bacterium]|jgi:hypothetical protein
MIGRGPVDDRIAIREFVESCNERAERWYFAKRVCQLVNSRETKD